MGLAYENLKNVWSAPADTDMSNEGLYQWTAVALGKPTSIGGNGSTEEAILAYASGNHFSHILQNNPVKGEAGTIASGCISQCRCLTAWDVGDALSVGANGWLQKAGGSDKVFAYAASAAKPGDVSTCRMPNT